MAKNESQPITFPSFSDSAPDLRDIPRGAAVLLTGLRSVFGPQLAAHWRKKGLEVVLISIEQQAKSGMLPDGTFILAAIDYEPKWIKAAKYGPIMALSKLEKKVYSSILQTQEIIHPYEYYSSLRYIGFNLGVIHLVRQLRPAFVFAQCLMRFGFAAGICQQFYPTLLMPYGQDIYRHSLSSFPHRKIAEWSLKHVDMICPASVSAQKQMVKEFGVDPKKIRPISWGIDRSLFYMPSRQGKLALREKYNIPTDAWVVMNARRFAQGWGSRTVTEAFLELAYHDDKYYFILIGGSGIESLKEFSYLQRRISQNDIGNRFLIFEHGVSIEIFSELLQVSDIFTSLMLGSDMRSASILQGIAAGVAPVVTEWPEYRYMERLGFQALFVPMHDVDKAVEAVEFYRHNPERMKETIEANLQYVAQHEDYDKQMDLLLQTINEVVEKRRRRS